MDVDVAREPCALNGRAGVGTLLSEGRCIGRTGRIFYGVNERLPGLSAEQVHAIFGDEGDLSFFSLEDVGDFSSIKNRERERSTSRTPVRNHHFVKDGGGDFGADGRIGINDDKGKAPDEGAF